MAVNLVGSGGSSIARNSQADYNGPRSFVSSTSARKYMMYPPNASTYTLFVLIVTFCPLIFTLSIGHFCMGMRCPVFHYHMYTTVPFSSYVLTIKIVLHILYQYHFSKTLSPYKSDISS